MVSGYWETNLPRLGKRLHKITHNSIHWGSTLNFNKFGNLVLKTHSHKIWNGFEEVKKVNYKVTLIVIHCEYAWYITPKKLIGIL